MSYQQSHPVNVGELSPLSLEYALLAPDVAAWQFEVDSGALLFSKEFPLVFQDNQRPFQHLSTLMDALSSADKYIFLQTFNSDPVDCDQGVRACEVKCFNDTVEYRVRFIGRLTSGKQRRYEGVVVPSSHWLANPGIETSNSLLRTLFAENPIASLMTDAKGVLLQANSAFEKLFEINSRKISAAVGRYSLLQDKQLQSIADMPVLLQQVYRSGETLSVDLTYSLDTIIKSFAAKKFNLINKKISLRASLLPIRNRYGELERVLIQLQDRSREENAMNILLKQQSELQESEASYKAFIANSSEAIWCYDMVPPISLDHPIETQVDLMAECARLSQGNKMLVTMLGASTLQDIIGQGLRESGSTRYVFDLQYFVKNNYQMVDHDIIREDRKGRRYYFQISCVGVIENNCLKRVWGTTKDVSVRKRYEHRLEHISLHDALTGLPNRANIYQEIERFYAKGGEAQGALLFIDLDRFKEINDTLGHQVGDRLLQLIGPRIQSEMSEIHGTVAR
ncbi:MAG: diguanylate cyclase, partial [Moraxellaceae bacterium]